MHTINTYIPKTLEDENKPYNQYGRLLCELKNDVIYF